MDLRNDLRRIDLGSKVAVVTGSGQGLGLAYATGLARHGAAAVVSNAGILRDGVLWKMSDDDFDAVIRVHLKGVTGQAFSAGGDRLALWSHPQLTATAYHDGGFSPEDIAAEWPTTFANRLESVGEVFPAEPVGR